MLLMLFDILCDRLFWLKTLGISLVLNLSFSYLIRTKTELILFKSILPHVQQAQQNN